MDARLGSVVSMSSFCRAVVDAVIGVRPVAAGTGGIVTEVAAGVGSPVSGFRARIRASAHFLGSRGG